MKPPFRNLARPKPADRKTSAAAVQAIFKEGLALHQQGQLAQAQAIYERVLKMQPGHFDALHLMGVVAWQAKNPLQAIELIGRAIEINPNAAAYSNRGNALKDLRRLDEALESYDRALKLKPDYAEALYNRGVTLQELNRHDEALESYDRALAIKPDYAEALYNRGNALRELMRLDEALESYEHALAIKPDYAKVYLNRGVALQELKRLDAALESYERALAINPDYAEALYNRGIALVGLKRFGEALESYERALAIKPDYAEALYNRGIALGGLKRFDEALESYERALKFRPHYAEALSNRGVALQELKRLDEAVESYDRALATKPDCAETLNNRGSALQGLGRFDDAMASFRRALEIEPDNAEAHNNLGEALLALVQIDDAVASYRRALKIKPDYAQAHSNLLFCLSHNATADAETLFAEHCRFAEQFEAPLRASWPQHTNSRNPERCLQVGFVSGDLRDHVMASFIEPVLAHLRGYPQLSLHAYYNYAVEDSVTQRLRRYLPHWHSIVGLSDEALAQKIRDDSIDILIDLSGHTGSNRLLTFARKPAPVQITWIGYPNTTGLQAMDYVLMDRFNAPYGVYERFYVEKLVRLPSSRTYLPMEDSPPVNDLPALSNGSVTFGSFNNSSKLGDAVIALWSQVLRAVPGSRLLLGNAGEGSLRANLMERFARCGVVADRLMFQPRVEKSAYMALHHQVDFILDTFPYTGGATTNDALWMGVPVLTLTGPSSRQCQCAGWLGRAGLTDWVADGAEDFVRRAVSWVGRLDELAGLRAGMRERLLSSPLRQPETVARGMETAFRMMHRRWCEDLPAESFELTLKDLGMDYPVGITGCGDQ